MRTIRPTDGPFGLPRTLTLKESEGLLRILTNLWSTSYGAPPSADLDEDLEKCRLFFDPVARGQRLRDAIARLPAAPPVAPSMRPLIGDPITVRVDAQRLLVGMEARLILEALRSPRSEGQPGFSEPEIAEMYRRAASKYRSWSRKRLDQVIDLITGLGGEPLQPIAVGFVLALLVNRSTVPGRALSTVPTPREEGTVDEAVLAAANAFANQISGRNGRSNEHRLKGGYHVSEAARRLGPALVRKTDSVYVDASAEGEVIHRLGAELAKRGALNAAEVGAAMDALVRVYRTMFASLALTSPAHERVADTEALKEQLILAFGRAREKPVL